MRGKKNKNKYELYKDIVGSLLESSAACKSNNY